MRHERPAVPGLRRCRRAGCGGRARGARSRRPWSASALAGRPASGSGSVPSSPTSRSCIRLSKVAPSFVVKDQCASTGNCSTRSRPHRPRSGSAKPTLHRVATTAAASGSAAAAATAAVALAGVIAAIRGGARRRRRSSRRAGAASGATARRRRTGAAVVAGRAGVPRRAGSRRGCTTRRQRRRRPGPGHGRQHAPVLRELEVEVRLGRAPGGSSWSWPSRLIRQAR